MTVKKPRQPINCSCRPTAIAYKLEASVVDTAAAAAAGGVGDGGAGGDDDVSDTAVVVVVDETKPLQQWLLDDRWQNSSPKDAFDRCTRLECSLLVLDLLFP